MSDPFCGSNNCAPFVFGQIEKRAHVSSGDHAALPNLVLPRINDSERVLAFIDHGPLVVSRLI